MTEIVAAAPGELTEIAPPRAQGHVQLLVTTGSPPTFTLIEPGSQAVGTGVQGTGVGVPSAAAVAAINAGFVGLWHMPKGGMFIPGTVSVTTAIGIPLPVVGRIAVSVLGAKPNVQLNIAPLVTGIPNGKLR